MIQDPKYIFLDFSALGGREEQSYQMIKHHFPNYKKSIVNLMSSIYESYGLHSPYPALRSFSPKNIQKYDNVVLLVLDALGYNYITQQEKKNFFSSYLIDRMTSVFPTTTIAATTSFITGLAPQQHGMTGWHMLHPVLNKIITPLPYTMRGTEKQIPLPTNQVYPTTSLFPILPIEKYALTIQDYKGSKFNNHFFQKQEQEGSRNNLHDLMRKLIQLVHRNKKKKYIYAYWADFDTLSHKYGPWSSQTHQHFKQLEKAVSDTKKQLSHTNSLLIITADHGQIDAQPLYLSDHPNFQKLLSKPLSGEPRTIYLHVKKGMKQKVINYVRSHLSSYATLYPSIDLIKKGVFGTGKQHPELKKRVGDFTLLMKEHYTLKDFIGSEQNKHHKGVHGGTSADEMFVPLIMIPCP